MQQVSSRSKAEHPLDYYVWVGGLTLGILSMIAAPDWVMTGLKVGYNLLPFTDVPIEAAAANGNSQPVGDTVDSPEVMAFLDTIAWAEGTGDSYNIQYTFAQFEGFADHPRQIKCSGELCSDAAGRYQFLSTTWDSQAKAAGLKDFSPQSQDLGAIQLLKANGAYDKIKSGDIEGAVNAVKSVWASFPGAGHDQPEKSMDQVLKVYQEKLATRQQHPSITSSPSQTSVSSHPLTADDIAAKVAPSVVEVWVSLPDGGKAPAAGIVVKDDGLIATNYHVIESDPNPTIQTKDGQTLTGQTIASNPSLDLALIQVQGVSGLTVANFADTAQAEAGQTVYAIGSPNGERWKLTQAQVLEASSICGKPALDGQCIRTPSGFLRPGNSGGALINERGQVIGMNRAISESSGEGVSILIELVMQFVGSNQP